MGKKLELGDVGKDVITNFQGVIVGRSEYISGCVQLLLQPTTLTPDGKRPDGEWFDEQRVQGARGKRIVLQNLATPGPDREAPKR